MERMTNDPRDDAQQPAQDAGSAQAGLGEPEDVSTPHERVCYSDECAEPCRSYQVRLRAELAEYKALAEKTGRRLGRARQDLSSLQREIREVAASQSYRAALLGMHPSHEVIGSLAAQERQDADRLHALGTCDLTGADS